MSNSITVKGNIVMRPQYIDLSLEGAWRRLRSIEGRAFQRCGNLLKYEWHDKLEDD